MIDVAASTSSRTPFSLTRRPMKPTTTSSSARAPSRDPDPLEAVIDATPADRLGWELIEQGIDPATFELADDHSHPGTVLVRATFRTAARGLISAWWDEPTGKAAGLAAGTVEEMQEAAAALDALTAAGGPGHLPLAPPEGPLDPSAVIAATAWRLGLALRFRPWAGSSEGKVAFVKVRNRLARIPPAMLLPHLRPTLYLLASYADSDGSNAYPSAQTLGSELGIARSTVSGHLQQLEALGVIGSTGERKSWSQYVNTKIRYIDFMALDALTDDQLGHQATDDAPARQAGGTDDGETGRMTERGLTDDAPGGHNLPNHYLNQASDDSAETSSPAPVADGAAIAAIRGGRSWDQVIEETAHSWEQAIEEVAG